MDLTQASAIATPVLCLISAFLEKVSDGAAGGLGKKFGEEAAIATKELFAHVRQAFSKTPETEQVLAQLEGAPKDIQHQREAQMRLTQLIAEDDDLGVRLTNLLRRADLAGADSWFKTSIHGNVEKLVQIGAVHGNVNL